METSYFHTIKSILNTSLLVNVSFTTVYFHTIKSILNCTAKQYDILYDLHFHTIKSILNITFFTCPPNSLAFPYY